MRRTFIPFVVLGIVLAGCQAQEETPTPRSVRQAREATEEKSPEQIANELRQNLNPLRSYVGPDARIPPPVADKALDGLKSDKKKHQVTENGNQALNIIASEVAEAIRTADDKESWAKIPVLVAALQVLEPGNDAYDRYVERAKVELNRPQVSIRGFFSEQSANETVAFLNVYEPETQKMLAVNAREGEEFLGLRFLSVIGKNQGVRLEYMKTGESFDVFVPRAGGPAPPGYDQTFDGGEEDSRGTRATREQRPARADGTARKAVRNRAREERRRRDRDRD